MEMKIVLEGGYKVNAIYKGFTIRTDQPEDVGGENTAPEPFDMFLASIGTCSGVYVADFCNERNIPTENIGIIMSIDRDGETNMVTRVTINVSLPPEFPQKYLRAIEKAINMCTVKKHLQDPPEFLVEAKMAE